ncbi:hypothetical protein MPTK1_1g02850 [Marchantia polymorpha subsp. ruderalis]|uniref:Uncharacterized protein n=2 Tax=Marchantia polymorpha TaxID=3197 RepID=A0AAF6AKV6_MARPO|nr:hypothetical protein MARPO_0113s0033 [Marchantia polymorpha]BBM97076.1 hypothetical protein Mp_1g02850 [Marchantia polymorpha subsp. ruderalis]|eukprot:PTQ31298.1 hypothetical protein MARPO_0113s0033 [Marchantia polymorpha]
MLPTRPRIFLLSLGCNQTASTRQTRLSVHASRSLARSDLFACCWLAPWIFPVGTQSRGPRVPTQKNTSRPEIHATNDLHRHRDSLHFHHHHHHHRAMCAPRPPSLPNEHRDLTPKKSMAQHRHGSRPSEQCPRRITSFRSLSPPCPSRLSACLPARPPARPRGGWPPVGPAPSRARLSSVPNEDTQERLRGQGGAPRVLVVDRARGGDLGQGQGQQSAERAGVPVP